MAISLVKGQGVSLTKVAPSLTEVFFGLGWDANTQDSDFEFDLDASAFLLDAKEKLISEAHFIFYNNLTSPDGGQSVQHLGDNDTGEGDGDDEIIKVHLKKVPFDVQKIVFTVGIFDAEKRHQNFGQIKNAFVRLVNDQTQEEVLRYNLVETFSVETAFIMAELYRQDGEWQVKAIGSGSKKGIEELIERYTPAPEPEKHEHKPVINWRYRVSQPSK